MSAEFSNSRRRGSVKGATLHSPGRRAALRAAALSPFGLPQARAAQSPPVKTLRYAFDVAETGFDPAQINDLYSRIITAHIFDGLYDYDYLARPFKIVPNTADGMPDVSSDFVDGPWSTTGLGTSDRP